MSLKMCGHWHIYACDNKEKHTTSVTFAIVKESDNGGIPYCPICEENANVEYLDSNFLEG